MSKHTLPLTQANFHVHQLETRILAKRIYALEGKKSVCKCCAENKRAIKAIQKRLDIMERTKESRNYGRESE